MANQRRSTVRWSLAAAGPAFVAALTLYAATAAPTITARYGGADGGELAAVALSGGVAHPPGYPSYLLLARAALLLPWGEPARRLALLSALCGALAVACTALLVALRPSVSSARTLRSRSIAGLYAGLTLMLSARLWSQAIIVEVYALHLLWLTLCALLFCGWLGTGRAALLAVAAGGFGLGLGTHLTLGALLPAAIVAWTVAPRRDLIRPGLALAAVAALLASLALYGCLPLWAAREALPSWGDPRSPWGWWQHISAAEYRYLVGAAPWSQRLARLGHAARDLLAQPGPIALALAIGWGLPRGWHSDRPLLALSGIVALSSLLFAIGYGGADSSVYLLPWTWAWCVWAGLGAGALWTQLGGSARRWLLRSVLGALLAGGLVWSLAVQYRSLDLHADTSERERVVARLMALEPDAIVLTSADADTFGGWYLQRALGVRRDVLVVDTRLLRWSWYRAQLARQLGATDDGAICRTLQSSARPRYRLDAESGSVESEAEIEETVCAGE